MKVAILVREETADKCVGKGCLRAFWNQQDAFESYPEDAELIAFTHIGGDLDHKIARLKEYGVEVVHLSSCLRAKYEGYEALKTRLEKDFQVVGYTHGSQERKPKEV